WPRTRVRPSSSVFLSTAGSTPIGAGSCFLNAFFRMIADAGEHPEYAAMRYRCHSRDLVCLYIKRSLYLKAMDLATTLGRLEAAAEASRLRLLAVLTDGEAAVNELTSVLGQ